MFWDLNYTENYPSSNIDIPGDLDELENDSCECTWCSRCHALLIALFIGTTSRSRISSPGTSPAATSLPQLWLEVCHHRSHVHTYPLNSLTVLLFRVERTCYESERLDVHICGTDQRTTGIARTQAETDLAEPVGCSGRAKQG